MGERRRGCSPADALTISGLSRRHRHGYPHILPETIGTAEYVRSVLDYDPETGIFVWKPKAVAMFKMARRPIQLNATAGYGTLDAREQRQECLGAVHLYLVTVPEAVLRPSPRLAAFLWRVAAARSTISNGDRFDNRIANLRLATNGQNQANRPKPTRNTSGYKGVSWDKRARRWKTEICCRGSKHFRRLF